MALVALGFAMLKNAPLSIGWGERGTGAYSGDRLPPEIVAESERRAVEAARTAGDAADAAIAVRREQGGD